MHIPPATKKQTKAMKLIIVLHAFVYFLYVITINDIYMMKSNDNAKAMIKHLTYCFFKQVMGQELFSFTL